MEGGEKMINKKDYQVFYCIKKDVFINEVKDEFIEFLKGYEGIDKLTIKEKLNKKKVKDITIMIDAFSDYYSPIITERYNAYAYYVCVLNYDAWVIDEALRENNTTNLVNHLENVFNKFISYILTKLYY